MTHLSLFTGIGGLDIAAEWAGIRTVAQCEADPFCRKVLAKHWPDVPRFTDVRTLRASDVPEPVDIISGGFPCQDVSNAGTATRTGLKGLDGKRSGLWYEMHRLVREVEPRWVVIENVAALVIRGLDQVLHDLATIRFDAEWGVVRASDVGAPHRRRRLAIVASRQDVPNSGCQGLEGHVLSTLAYAAQRRHDSSTSRPDWGNTTPVLRGAPDGVPDWMDRIKALGNSVVPQLWYPIFRAIVEAER